MGRSFRLRLRRCQTGILRGDIATRICGFLDTRLLFHWYSLHIVVYFASSRLTCAAVA